MLGYAHVIVIIPHTTALGRSTRPLRGPVHGGEEGHRAVGGGTEAQRQCRRSRGGRQGDCRKGAGR